MVLIKKNDIIKKVYRLATYSDLGLNLIVDHLVLNQVDGKEQKLFDRFMKQLDD